MLKSLTKSIGRAVRGLSDIGAAIVRPFERAVSALFGIVLASVEGANRIGDLFGFLRKGMAWPFLTLGNGLRQLGAKLLPKFVRRAFATAGTVSRRLFRNFFRSVRRLGEKLNLDRLVQGLVWILQPVWRPIASVCLFTYAWLETRHWRKIRWGLPAFAMLLLVAFIGAYSALLGKGAAISRYQVALKHALEEKNYDQAQLYERTLAELGADTQLAKYNTAITIAEEGQLEQAYQRMQLLAPVEQPGYASAHVWIIQQSLGGKLSLSKEESLKLAKLHLDHLKALKRSGPYLDYLQAVLLIQDQHLEEAAEQLKPLLSLLPSAAFERLRIDIALKRPEEAREDALALITHMSVSQQNGKTLSSTDYQWWLVAEEVLGNWKQMHRLLDQLLQLDPGNEPAKRTLAKVCHHEANQLLRAPLPDPELIAQLWLDAFELERDITPLRSQAIESYHKRSQLPVYSLVLNALCESSRTPANVLLAVGTQAAQDQQYEEARIYLGAALERDASDPAAWNNYGVVLSEGGNVDFPAALSAVERAIKLRPDEYRFHETRGQILVRLKRWPDAIKELEFALNGMPEYTAIHASLATAYTALGNDELARLHQSRVD